MLDHHPTDAEIEICLFNLTTPVDYGGRLCYVRDDAAKAADIIKWLQWELAAARKESAGDDKVVGELRAIRGKLDSDAYSKLATAHDHIARLEGQLDDSLELIKTGKKLLGIKND